jgi:hypothetical protein
MTSVLDVLHGIRACPTTRPLMIGLVCLLLALAIGQRGPSAATAQTLPSPSPQSSGKHEMVSWVVLSKTYVDFDAREVRRKLDELYPGRFLPADQPANFVVGGKMPGMFIIKSTIAGAAGIFILLNVPGPYTDFSDFAESIADRALRRQAEAQTAWFSVDLIGKITTNEEAYRFIGAAVARLAPADAAFLVKPATKQTIVFDDKIRGQLASGQPVP